jgi:hypothetical protein
MALTYEHPHSLGLTEARRRLLEQAAAQGVEVRFDPGSEQHGEVRAPSPLGPVVARFALGPDSLRVEVTKKPAFVPEGPIRSALADGLGRLLG